MDAYMLAGIDVHKKMLAVVVTNLGATNGELVFERRKFEATPAALGQMAAWLSSKAVQCAVMESTAQYWKPVWRELEGKCELHLAQAQSNRAPKGRKGDFVDAERLVRRFVAGELILSFVPEPEQRLWRTLTHSRNQLTRDKVRLVSQLEAFLEDARIKLSSVVSQLDGVSSQRMLEAIGKGERDPAVVALEADPGLRATQEQLRDCLSAAATLDAERRSVLQLFLERLALLEKQIRKLNALVATLLQKHNDPVVAVAEIPGMGVDSAQMVIAEIGPAAEKFDSAAALASWIGVCPGREESAGVSHSNRSPKGNRTMRRVLCQAANAVIKSEGCAFELLYRRLVPRLGHNRAIWAVAHRISRVIWKVLHDHVRYEERGHRTNLAAAHQRSRRLAASLRRLGYTVLPPASIPALP
jgi:transposase